MAVVNSSLFLQEGRKKGGTQSSSHCNRVFLFCVGGVEKLSAQGTIEIGDSEELCTFKSIMLLHNA